MKQKLLMLLLGGCLVISLTGCGKEEINYYCYDGHTLSDKMCFYTELYTAQVVCPSGFYETGHNSCAQKGTGALLNVKVTYTCPNGGSLDDSGKKCVVEHFYKAFTENPNKTSSKTASNKEEVINHILKIAKNYFLVNNVEKVTISELLSNGFITENQVKYDNYTCDGYIINTDKGLETHINCSN